MSKWQGMDTAPNGGDVLLGVWEGDWSNAHQRFRVYHATMVAGAPSWSMRDNYRTEEGGAYAVAGWMPLPSPPQPAGDRNER